MFRRKKLLKAIAIFLLLDMMNYIIWPTISYALTAGPTAPEYSSFEPVDTTDMVNMKTGDLVYNLPLLEVSGRSGSYPISLSYHSGIKTKQEASWVGLGWTLNAGAINRYVNGIPDDMYNRSRHVVDDWEGGTTKYYGIGVGYAGAMAKLTVATDTYKGMGMGWSLGASYGVNYSGMDASLNGELGENPYGGQYGSIGGSIGTKAAVSVGMSANLVYDFNTNKSYGNSGISVGTGIAGMSINNKGNTSYSLGASIASGNKGSTGNMLAGFSQKNKNYGKITTETSGFSTTIPAVYVDIYLQYQRVRYYSHEESEVNTYGSLYPGIFDPENSTFDSYPVFNKDISINKNAEVYSIASFPSYDSYSVSAQGVGGNMQPYILDFGPLYRQNDNSVEYFLSNKNFSRKVNFRFKNDFSGYYLNHPPINPDDRFTFNDSDSVEYPNSDENSLQNYFLSGSNHIEWFTYDDISGDKGKKLKFIREWRGLVSDLSEKQIAGFQITNSSGVKYHYSLPVYNINEYTRSELLDDRNGATYRETSNIAPYAYTWLLTGVTGPDYVDRNNNGILDNGDWGYWVRFYYGQWTNDYQWRNPLIGKHIDIEQNIRTFSWGQKEVYYLDAIQTSDQTAIFVKKIRNDGKGLAINGHEPSEKYTEGNYPAASLRLEDIYVFENSKLSETIRGIRAKSDEYVHSFSNLSHNGKSVIDIHDIDKIPDWNTRFTKRIHFTYDYSLCNHTSNSYDENYQSHSEPVNPTKTGKLTLKSITTFGKRNEKKIPPINFKYSENNPDYSANAYDLWGYYKPGVPSNIEDENIDRVTTVSSAALIDAWSLTKIISPLGSTVNIDYESDTYASPEIYDGSIFRVENLQVNNGNIEIFLSDNSQYSRIFNAFKSGNNKSVGLKVLVGHRYIEYKWKLDLLPPQCKPDVRKYDAEYETLNIDKRNVLSVEDGKIVIGDSDDKIKDFLQSRKSPSLGFGSPPPLADCTNAPTSRTFIDEDPVFVGGLLSVSSEHTYYGGGLRVKEISVEDQLTSTINATVYTYTNPDKPEINTSGVTTYGPYNIGYYNFQKPDPSPVSVLGDEIAGHRFFDNMSMGIIKFRDILINERELMQKSREIPPPGVMYEYVQVNNYVRRKEKEGIVSEQLPTYKEFKFSVYKDDISVEFPAINTFPTGGDYFMIKDNTSQIGQLLNVSTYNLDNKLLYETRYLYQNSFSDDHMSIKNIGKQGIVKQSFYEYKDIVLPESSAGHATFILVSSKVETPNALIGVVSKNYKTGISVRTTNLDYDLYSGQPTEVLTEDLKGNKYVSLTIPAYQAEYQTDVRMADYTVYPGMGLAKHGGLNMLNQTVATYLYKVKANFDPEIHDSYHKESLVSASVQTWSNEVKNIYENPWLNARLTTDRITWTLHTEPDKFSIGDVLTFDHDALTVVVTDYVAGSDTYEVVLAGPPPPDTGISGNIRLREPYKKHKIYIWIGDKNLNPDGTYPIESEITYKNLWWNESYEPTTPKWQKTNEITLYDHYSHALEAKDINGNYAATKMDVDHSKVFSTAVNAAYHEFGFTGAENMSNDFRFSGGIMLGIADAGERSKAEGFPVHTGNYSIEVVLDGGTALFYDFPEVDRDKIYRLSVWVHEDNKDKLELYARDESGDIKVLTGTELTEATKAGEWLLAVMDVSLKSTTGQIQFGCRSSSGTGLIVDDFRYHPYNASMTGYVYNEWGELSAVLDNDNMATFYEYDAMGRLKSVYQESFKYGKVKVSENEIHYARNHN